MRQKLPAYSATEGTWQDTPGQLALAYLPWVQPITYDGGALQGFLRIVIQEA